jgi:hypothetical protein
MLIIGKFLDCILTDALLNLNFYSYPEYGTSYFSSSLFYLSTFKFLFFLSGRFRKFDLEESRALLFIWALWELNFK